MVFVTGGTGLLGAHLITQLVKQQHQVRALYRSEIPVMEGADQVQWIKGDILDTSLLADAMENVRQVYHCAGMVSFNPKQKEILHKTNVEGTANVVNACLAAGVEKLVHVSSVAALGRLRQHKMINETMVWTEETSNSEYGKTKYLGEMEVWRGVGEGLQCVIVNPSIILGAGDWGGGSSALFKNVYKEFPWYTDGVTGFVDVADVALAMQMLMNSNIAGQRFIVSAANVGYHQLFTEIAQFFGKKPAYKKVTPFLAALVWRMEALKEIFTGKRPLLTRETAKTAQAKVYFDNTKLIKYLPAFSYTPVTATLERICNELKINYHLA